MINNNVVMRNLPKLFRSPVVLHDMVPYAFGSVSPEKRRNWVLMNRAMLDTEHFSVPAYPYLMQIEPTNRCNLACPMCPCGTGELGREPRDMALGEFQSLLDDMGRYLLLLVLWSWGEPFMNRALPQMIRCASEQGIRTVTSTNCHFLKDEDFVAEIMTAGLSTLIVAVDSVDLQNYAAYRKRGNVDRVAAGVQRLVELKRKTGAATRINLRMVVMRQNEHEIDRVREFARSLGADLFSVKTANPSYGNNYHDAEMVPQNPALRRYAYRPGTFERMLSDRACRRVWTMSNVHSDGSVVPCCRDYDGSMTLGNILDQPFSEIWMSDAYRELRKAVYYGKATLEKCKSCDESFAFSRTGWFSEMTEFHASGTEPFLTGLRNRFYTPKLRTIVNQIHKRI